MSQNRLGSEIAELQRMNLGYETPQVAQKTRLPPLPIMGVIFPLLEAIIEL